MILISAALNVSLTSAIAWKIWWQYRQLGRTAQRREAHYLHIMWLIVESGMVVAFAQVLILILGAIHNSGYQIVTHAITPLVVSAVSEHPLPLSHYSRRRASLSLALSCVSKRTLMMTSPTPLHLIDRHYPQSYSGSRPMMNTFHHKTTIDLWF